MPRKSNRLRPFRPAARDTGPAGGGELGALLNLGPKSSAWLVAAGLHTRADLERVGTIEACRRMRQRGFPVSLLAAYAIEGALMGCHWNALPLEFKQHLRAEFARLRRETSPGVRR